MAWWDDALDAHLDHEALEGFVTVEEAAQQMGVSEQRVHQLVRQRTLRSAYHGPAMLVEPAITNRS